MLCVQAFPALEPEDVVYEPRSSRLLVRGLGEAELDEEEEDYESSARLLGMSFMNRSSALRPLSSPYTRQSPPRSCSQPSGRVVVVCVFILVLVASMVMVLYFLPGCTFTQSGCRKANSSSPLELVYPLASNGKLFPWTSLRLPASVRPLDYDLSLHPNLTSMTFTGHTVITMAIQHDTKRIVLHSAELNITTATFKLGEAEAKTVEILEYPKWQQIALSFPEDLRAGQQCVLTLTYEANMSHNYEGFYNSSYIDPTGTRRVLAATQFEPLAARKAFPCFDEPAFKATFLVRITRESDYITLSNMPKSLTTTLPNGLLEDEYERSVNMSSYLVAFIVANFTSVSTNISDTVVSVYSVPEKKDHTHYALDTATKLLQFYNTFFDINYPLKKLDLIAIPDFLAGAMENWGLITFRETSLLVGNHSSPLDKQLVASVIAHELAHQWFGNLVTMRWWNDLWLNEGFATYMQYMSLDRELPQLDVGNLFLKMRFGALAKDALNSSHPVSAQVNTPEQVSEMFDSVSYEKGASILLMLNASMPDGQFRKGIIQYLNKFRGSNTVTDDLWNCLTQAQVPPPSESVLDMMNTWTRQKGFPLVTASLEGDELTLTQEHFTLSADDATRRNTSLWHIPVTYVTEGCSSGPSCRQTSILKTKMAKVKLPASVQWVKMNYMSSGFYISDYGEKGWTALTDALKTDVNILSSQDRASLIHDIFALSRLGRVSFKQVLSLLDYFSKETESAPLTEALSQLTNVYHLLDKRQENGLVSRMKTYIFDHFGDLMDSQSWEKEDSVSKQELRSALLMTACSLDRLNCTTQATQLFTQYIDSNYTLGIPSDLQRVVFGVAAQTEAGWPTVLESYKHASYDAEKRRMLLSLASTQDVRRIVWILKAGLEGKEIQTQELPLVLDTVSHGFAGYLFAWDFVQEHWDELIKKFPVGSFPIMNIIKSTTSQFSTQTRLDQVKAFFTSLKERGSEMRSVQEALETIKLNQRWMEGILPTLRQWL